MSAIGRVLPRIEEMMFRLAGLVKRGLGSGLRKMRGRLGLRGRSEWRLGNGGRSALSIAP